MDPNACLDRMLDCLKDSEFDDLAFACGDMLEWLNKGGFPPKNMSTKGILEYTNDLHRYAMQKLLYMDSLKKAASV